jgi:RNA polymerase sigma-70 factor, ECF subfamily
MENSTGAFEQSRGRLFALAYRMLGSRAEAEDVVQDAYVRWHQSDRDVVRNAEAWLVTTTTRLAIDRLRALKTERDAYPGPWLPEPMVHSAPPPPDRHLDLAADLSMAFMTLLERLGPDERVAFLLHEVFEFDYTQIAAILEKNEDACRQIVHRARSRVRSARKRFDVSEAAKADVLRRFMTAVNTRDEKTLLALFAPDATWTSDGGGRAAAATRPIEGADRIAKVIIGLHDRLHSDIARLELIEINGETGLCLRTEGRVTAVLSIESDGERIHAVYAVVNPDKLRSVQ